MSTREVEVRAILNGGHKSYSTGYAVGGSLVLTANVAENAQMEALEVRFAGTRDFIRAVAVHRRQLGVEILVLNPMEQSQDVPRYPAASWGELAGNSEVTCESLIVTRSVFADGTHTRVVPGVVDPRNRIGPNGLVMVPKYPPSSKHTFHEWDGALGAAVLCDGAIVGVFVGLEGQDGRRIHVERIGELVRDRAFADLLKRETGSRPVLVAIERTDADKKVSETIARVASVDPTNIQEVAASQIGISNLYYDEVLKQAKRSFRAAIVAAVLGLVFLLSAVMIALLTEEMSASVISSIGGAVVEAISGLNFWLYGRAAAQLDQFHQRLERMQRYLLANSVCFNIEESQRAAALNALVAAIAAGKEDASPRPAGDVAKRSGKRIASAATR